MTPAPYKLPIGPWDAEAAARMWVSILRPLSPTRADAVIDALDSYADALLAFPSNTPAAASIVGVPSRKNRADMARIERIRELFEAYVNGSEIAQQIGVSRARVQQIIARHGITRACKRPGCPNRLTNGLYCSRACRAEITKKDSTREYERRRALGLRRCCSCAELKPVSEFSKHETRCKPCKAAKTREKRRQFKASDEMKRCAACGEEKHAQEFATVSYCRPCSNARNRPYQRAYYARKRTTAQEQARAF